MKLKFYWCHAPAGPLAFCTSDVLDSSGISPLCCLLMDDGGIDWKTASNWLEEGISRVDRALSAEARQSLFWARECWGAELGKTETKIYSLLEDSVWEKVNTLEFRNVLAQWLNFIATQNKLQSMELVLMS